MRDFFLAMGFHDLMGDAFEKMKRGIISPDSLMGVLARMEAVIQGDA